MKNHYIAVIITENEKNYSYMIKVSVSDNLISRLQIKGIVAANIFPTKKAAADCVRFWNQSFKNNGSFMFDN